MAVGFVHGGPVPDAIEVRPRDWPSYQAYGAWAAHAGLRRRHLRPRVHQPPEGRPGGRRHRAGGRGDARASPRRRRPGRGLGFSGTGALLARWIGGSRPWLRGVAATYPLCRPLGELPVQPRRPVSLPEAVASTADQPLLLTRVGLERPEVAETVAEFVAAAEDAGARLDVIDVPDGHHGFDQVDDTDASREAVRQAMAWVEARLRWPPAVLSRCRWRAAPRSCPAGRGRRACG